MDLELLSALASLASAISSCVTAITVIAATIIAYCGLRQWRAELTGKSRIELARKIALLGIRFKAAFEYARNPSTFAHESEARPREPDEDPERSGILDSRFARLGRLEPPREIRQDLEQASWEADVILGDDLAEFIQPFQQAFGRLWIAVVRYYEIHLKLTGAVPRISPTDILQREVQERTELFDTIYSVADDEFSQQISEATEALKRHLKPYLE
jgi:hypothetical protein